APGGFAVLGVAHFRSRIVSGWRRALPLLMGLLPAVLLVVATVAQEAALGAVILRIRCPGDTKILQKDV
ncbi:MAG: hypothetical protein AAB252_07620, partial [Pseudomonadota bacterium]